VDFCGAGDREVWLRRCGVGGERSGEWGRLTRVGTRTAPPARSVPGVLRGASKQRSGVASQAGAPAPARTMGAQGGVRVEGEELDCGWTSPDVR
jgi:hypothetical protein